MKEIDILGYMIGSRMRCYETEESDHKQQSFCTISTRTITDLAFLAVYRNIRIPLNFMKMPWGIEAAQIYDKLSILTYSGYIRENGNENSWCFSKNINQIKTQILIQNDESTLENLDLIIKTTSTLDDDELTEFVEILSEKIKSNGPIPPAFSEVFEHLEHSV